MKKVLDPDPADKIQRIRPGPDPHPWLYAPQTLAKYGYAGAENGFKSLN